MFPVDQHAVASSGAETTLFSANDEDDFLHVAARFDLSLASKARGANGSKGPKAGVLCSMEHCS